MLVYSYGMIGGSLSLTQTGILPDVEQSRAGIKVNGIYSFIQNVYCHRVLFQITPAAWNVRKIIVSFIVTREIGD